MYKQHQKVTDMEEKELALSKPNRTSTDLCVFSTLKGFEVGEKMARELSKSVIIPDNFRGEENIGSCMVAIDLAARMGLNPLMVMQNLSVVHNKPSFSGKFLIGLVNASGLYKSHLKFEQVGTPGQPNFGCRAYAIDWDGDKIYGPVVDMQMAMAEGWYNRNPKWKNMPSLMLRYRAGSFFVSTNCPELTFGIPTKEEIEDTNGVVDIPSTEVVDIDIDAVPIVEAPKEAQKVEKKVEVPPIKDDLDF